MQIQTISGHYKGHYKGSLSWVHLSILFFYLTWVSVELHDRNYRPLVWLWRPFHKCFVHLRRGWDTKSDIIDVFTTFFLLSYGKIMYQTLLLMSFNTIINVDKSGQQFFTYQCLVDQSIVYGSKYHLSFAIPAVLISLVFNVGSNLINLGCSWLLTNT